MQASVAAICGSVVAAHGDLEHRLKSCGTRASLFHGLWDFSGSRIEPVSPALAGRFFTTEPPGKPKKEIFKQGMGRREMWKHEGLVCIYVLVHPTHPVPKTLASCVPKGTESVPKIYNSHVVCIWTKCLRFQNVTLLCILTTEWKNWGMEHVAPPGFLSLSCWHFELENSFWGCWCMHCQMFCSISGLHALDVSSNPAVTTKNVPSGHNHP